MFRHTKRQSPSLPLVSSVAVSRQAFLKRELRAAKLGFRYHDSRSSVMEGVFSRGDRRSGEALIRAYELGARLDGCWQLITMIALYARRYSHVPLGT